MENKNNGDFVFKLLVTAFVVALAVQLLKTLTAAVAVFLAAVFNVLLVVGGIIALVLAYRFLTDQQYGETRSIRQIDRLERQRQMANSRLPKHLRSQADVYFKQQQEKFYDLKTYSRIEAMLERTKQIIDTFRKKGKNE